MYEYIKGEITELTPTYLVLECYGVGYFINISVNTFSLLSAKKQAVVYIHQVIREDAHLMFGFADKLEREIFRHLISVSGVGPNTARMMLSSQSPTEIKVAIVNHNISLLKSIKGIGAKTAERIVIDLKDKLGKIEIDQQFFGDADNTIRDEALSALVMLGFGKKQVEKAIGSVMKGSHDFNVEELIKEALKKL